MSSQASLRVIGRQEEKKGFRKIRKGFLKEMNILKESKQRYFYIQFNRIITLAENNALGVSKEELITLMENYIKENKKPEV
jgi:hypothetical protein